MAGQAGFEPASILIQSQAGLPIPLLPNTHFEHGAPCEIRTRDLRLEGPSSWATRRTGHESYRITCKSKKPSGVTGGRRIEPMSPSRHTQVPWHGSVPAAGVNTKVCCFFMTIRLYHEIWNSCQLVSKHLSMQHTVFRSTLGTTSNCDLTTVQIELEGATGLEPVCATFGMSSLILSATRPHELERPVRFELT